MTDSPHIALYGPLDENETGPSRVTSGLARGLTEQGAKVEVVAHGDKVSIPGTTVHMVGGMPGSVRGFQEIHRRGRETVESLDVDVTHSLKGTGVGFDVRTVQGTLVQLEMLKRCRSEFDPRSALGEVIVSYLSRKSAQSADKFVATSPEVQRETECYWRLSPDQIIPLGVDSSTLTEPTPIGDTRQVFFPGRLTPKKGQLSVLNHLQLDPKVSVKLAGSQANEGYANQILSDWGDHYEGFVSRERLEQLYCESDIAVVPSVHECFSVTAVEAIAHGCALVITDSCGFATFPEVQNCPGVRVVPDGRTAADAVREFTVMDRTELASCQASARDLAEQFTWESVSEEYLEIYEKI